MAVGRCLSLSLGVVLVAVAGSRQFETRGGWPTHGGNAQHTAISSVPAQALRRIVWSAPLDLQPQYNGDILYAHYGSPVVSSGNIVVMPVKTGANDGFRIEARSGATGNLLWQEKTDYVTPDHSWFPTLGPTIVGANVAYARKAGLIGLHALVPTVDSVSSRDLRPLCFYGTENYLANPAAYDNAVRISSPIVTGDDGSLYFTYRVQGTTPLGLKGGLAMVDPRGVPSYVEGAVATGDASFTTPKLNAAPSVSGKVVYAIIKQAGGSSGMLVGLNARTLAPLYQTALLDPRNGNSATVDDEGTACPALGPDGDVYFGVLENPFGTHHYRGWLLHFDRTLSQTKTPASFGWDDTPSIIPRSIVPSYTGTSDYLVMTKYNNYAGPGDGVNRIALLDPNATQADAYSNATVMKEVLTKVGPTPDAGNVGSFPNAVREWCINTAAVDVKNHSILVNNEDGIVYRWNLDTNSLDQNVRITNGIGQAYTPTVIGTDGLVYAISNARLYAIGL